MRPETSKQSGLSEGLRKFGEDGFEELSYGYLVGIGSSCFAATPRRCKPPLGHYGRSEVDFRAGKRL